MRQRKRSLARHPAQEEDEARREVSEEESDKEGLLAMLEEGVTQLGKEASKRKLNWRNSTAESLSSTLLGADRIRRERAILEFHTETMWRERMAEERLIDSHKTRSIPVVAATDPWELY